jgi:hypothetical protein
MRRGLVAFFALSLVGFGLTGCGLFRFEQREAWRSQAEEACLSQRLVQPSAYMALSSKIDGPGVCGMDYPFKVSAFNNGSVGLKSKVTLACPIIPSIDTWLDEIVKPAALMYFGVPVVDVKAGSYSCRPRNNRAGAKLSEHSFGNALDVMGFVLADGREVSVVKGWKGNPVEQEFLREAFVGACRYFTTVLGPGSDAYHYDHLHLDLARHDPHGRRRVCKPILKFTPRIDPEQSRLVAQDMAPSTDLSPIDMEQDVSDEGAPMTPYETAPASRPPANTGYAADLPARNPPSATGAYPQAPQAQTRVQTQVQTQVQTYPPPASQRPWGGGPLPLTGSGIY